MPHYGIIILMTLKYTISVLMMSVIISLIATDMEDVLAISETALHQSYDGYCIYEKQYNYTITFGEVKRICSNYDETVLVEMRGVMSNATLTVDVPYSDMTLMTNENYLNFYFLIDAEEDSEILNHLKVTHQYTDYQTFNFDLLPSNNFVEIIYPYSMTPGNDKTDGTDHDYNLTIPILKIEKTPCKSEFTSLTKSDKSKTVCVKLTSVEKFLDRGFTRVTVITPTSLEVTSEKYVYSGGGVATFTGHGTSSQFIPALYTIDIPTTISVGETFSIPYTLSWYDPNGEPIYLDSTITNIEGLQNHIRFFMPEEFTVLKEDAIFEWKMADVYSPHYGDWYMFKEFYSSDVLSGTIEVRLDKPLYHDRDMIIFIIGGDELKFQTQRSDDGLVLVASDNLIDEYDKLQFYHLFNHWEDGDVDWRYELTYNEDVEHIPQIRTAPQVASDEPQIDIYLEDHVWSDYADFLRDVIGNGGNFSEYLETPTFTQKFIDDFTEAYPEFKLQSARQITGEQNSYTVTS